MADNINTSSATTTTMSSSTGAPVATNSTGGTRNSKLNSNNNNNNNHNKNHNNSDVLKSGNNSTNKHGNVIHRTTSESLRLGGENSTVNSSSSSSSKNSKPSKISSFQITSVTEGTSRASGGDNGDDSADDLDESHTDDNSRITDTPSFSEDTFSKEDVFFANNPIGTAPVIPTSSQYGLAIVTPPDDGGHMLNHHNHNLLNDIGVTDGGSIVNLNPTAGKNATEVDLKELTHRNERFKVVKIESTEPFKRGRWVCMDYLDHTTLQQTKQEGDGVDSAPQSHVTPPVTHSNLVVTRDSGIALDNNTDIESMPNSATHIQNNIDMSTSSPGQSANNQPQPNQNHIDVCSVDSGISNNGTFNCGNNGEHHVPPKQNHPHSMINIPPPSTISNVPIVQQHHHPQTLSQFNMQKVIHNDMPQTPPPVSLQQQQQYHQQQQQQQEPQQHQQLNPSTTGTQSMLTSPAAVLTNHAQGATLPSNLIHNIGTPPTALHHHQTQSQQTPNNPHHQAMSMVNISLHDNSPQSHQSSGGAAIATNQLLEQQQSQLNNSNTPNTTNNNPNNINNNNNNNIINNNNSNISHTPDGNQQQQQYIVNPPQSLTSQTSMSISSPNTISSSLPTTMTSGIIGNNNNNTVLNQDGQLIVGGNNVTATTQNQSPNTTSINLNNNNLMNEINEIAASTIKHIDDGQLQQQITALPGMTAIEDTPQPTEDGESLSELALALSSTNKQLKCASDVKDGNRTDGGDGSHTASPNRHHHPHHHHLHHQHHHHRHHGGQHLPKSPELGQRQNLTDPPIFTSLALGNCIKNLMNTASNNNNSGNVQMDGKRAQEIDSPNKTIQNFIKNEIDNIPVRSSTSKIGGEHVNPSKNLVCGGSYQTATTSTGGQQVVGLSGSGSASRSTSPQPVSSAGVNCFSGSNSEFASASGTSAVAIDNKIEQAMDLVKSHLMFAVREEVEVLKEKIAELMDRINQLEIENTILKQNATQETLSQLSATVASSKIPPANPANGPVS